MPVSLHISPHGHLVAAVAEETEGSAPLSQAAADRILAAFADSTSAGLLHLSTAELQNELPPSLSFARSIGREYLTRLCRTPGLESGGEVLPVAPPARAELEPLVLGAPPMKGLEYLTNDVLATWWTELDEHVRAEARAFAGPAQEYLRDKNPLWRLVGRVTFHLAENKRDESRPFAFMATYASRLSAQGKLQHQPLAQALREYGAKDREALLSLLMPIQRASERSEFVKGLVDRGDVYHPLTWEPGEAYRFLKEIPLLEESGLVVRVPDWWKSRHPPRPQVSVKIGEAAKSKLGADAILDFSVRTTLDGEPLSEAELQAILASSGGLVPLRGRWVEVDRDKLKEALDHWKRVERDARGGGISFFEGMRLLAGATTDDGTAAAVPLETKEWTGIEPGAWLEQTLRELRDPQAVAAATPAELHAELRPYQQVGVSWLQFMTRLGLGACLADDMGLGKTIQVIALLLHVKKQQMNGADKREGEAPAEPERAGKARVGGSLTLADSEGEAPRPSLLVAPASLLANWKSEIERFAPSLSVVTAHPSETDPERLKAHLDRHDLVMTTYGMLTRVDWLRKRRWNLAILDEAQAIKNAGTRQTRAVKELQASARITLTGTPVENRLSDLWSLFDFLNPGLLGGAKAFASFVKQLAKREDNAYGPLRALVKPYILRRLKTDKSVIADLPDKTEVNAFCTLSKRQAALYEQAVRELAEQLKSADGIQRRGIVLASLMRLKQICNHPSQWLANGSYDPPESGKFQRLAEIGQELAERQEKALVFTQFREITEPLANHLATIYGRPGLVLHGGTPVKERRRLVEAFQQEEGPPFFVLSLKAGGTGLNLTAASHVIHFDRWWNPAVENQATDRAFRIGQKRNVLVHKFVCRGTVEEKIDRMIAEKVSLANELLGEGGERLLTEMSNQELMRFVSLDIHRAVES
jgi:superfamily II DNA or RNA helicase